MALDLATRAAGGYPADLRGAAGVKIVKTGLRADLSLELRDVEKLSSAPTGGLVPVQDPTTGLVQALDFSQLPTAQPGNGTVGNVKLASAPALTVKGNTTNATAQPQDVPLSTIAAPGNPIGDAVAARLASASNLSDLASPASARTNLGLAAAATISDATRAVAGNPVGDAIAGRVPTAAAALSVKANIGGSAGTATDTSISDLAATSGVGIVRSQIANYRIPVGGFRTLDGAPWVRSTSTGPMAIQDASGQWWAIDASSGRLNPAWFRLPADGADWALAWNRAIGVLNARDGGELNIGAETHTFATRVKFPKTGKPITVRGVGPCSVMTNASGNTDYIFEIGDAAIPGGGSNVVLDNIRFAGTDRANSKAIRLLNANGTIFRAVRWIFMGVATFASDSYAVTFSNGCVFDNIENYCWYSDTPCHNLVWDNVRAYTCGVSADASRSITGQVLRIDGASFNIVLDKCDVELFSTFVQAGNGLYAPTITNSYIEYAKNTIFVGGSSAPIQNMEVSGNLFYGNGNQTWANLSGGFVHNNVFASDQGVGSLAFATSATNVIVQDNTYLGTHPATQTPWSLPAFTNNWVQQANYEPVGYRIGADGMVNLRGCCLNYTAIPLGGGTSANSVFTLPAGHRPSTIAIFTTAGTTGTGIVVIYPDGTVRVGNVGGAGTGGNPYQLGLSGIRFQPNN